MEPLIPGLLFCIDGDPDRTVGGAYSLRNMADPSPIGTAINSAPPATRKVPKTSGSTPKLVGSTSGAQRVPARKSNGDICAKKP